MWDFVVGVLVCIAVMALLNWFGWWQATKGMTEKEKEELLEYWKKNPFSGWYDD